MIRKIKGTMDILPDKTPLFRYIEGVMREEASRYGFGEIRTPMFENTDLFERGVGDTTDVVQKEMYTFADRDENRRISLRPEGTAPVVRALLEHGCQSDPMPLKYYYIISCFRHEAPQAGRSREFFQFGTELFGSDSALSDATVIALAASVFRRLGLQSIKLHLNSIGCAKCRPAYRDALSRHFGEHLSELCDTCHTRLEKNPLRLLDCKSPICSAIARRAPKTVDYLCDDCKAHFETLTAALDAMGIGYEIDPAIVRGLDYYTRTVFEFIADGIGAQSTVCGGGRYDGLVESLGGAPLSGIGFGMGLTRVILAMEQQGLADVAADKPKIYIAPLGAAAAIKAAEITERLRQSGVFAECDLIGRSLKAQMKYANKLGADFALILGDNEIETGRAQLRDMRNATQSEVEWESFTLPENA
jgi:histidyl-tRNA synthetase